MADTDAEAQRPSWTRTALLARTARTGTSALVPIVEEAAREQRALVPAAVDRYVIGTRSTSPG
ncbi:hypothetical protein [Streptomyces sp. 058-1L]|uniref:hypothetical protein n=1 Tax=Streptomyces sp. 058-1L TaxID=2789266 RepID=UPI00398133E0